MLSRIHIDNYKCLSNFDLRLHNLTLLAGANGCGKSAVFEVMDKLREFARESDEELIRVVSSQASAVGQAYGNWM